MSFKAAPGGGHKAWRTSFELKRTTGATTLNAGHHHPDAGTFVLLGHGDYLAIDEGYSNNKRHGHHNGILVDGHGYANEDRYHVYQDLPEQHTARIRSTLLELGVDLCDQRVSRDVRRRRWASPASTGTWRCHRVAL